MKNYEKEKKILFNGPFMNYSVISCWPSVNVAEQHYGKGLSSALLKN